LTHHEIPIRFEVNFYTVREVSASVRD
jgi:hypothetical protein